MNIVPLQLSYQQLVSSARQLPLTERVRLVRDILAEPTKEQEWEQEQKQLVIQDEYIDSDQQFDLHCHQIDSILHAAGLLTLAPSLPTTPEQLTKEQRSALARSFGDIGKPLSEIIIEEREGR